MDQFGDLAARAMEAALRPLEEAQIPTSWCHGDLWPGNVVLARGPAVLIDWEQARPKAPRGVDSVFLETYRLMIRSGIPFGLAAARAVMDLHALISPPDIDGIPWTRAPAPLRAALVAAAVVVNALGPRVTARSRVGPEEHGPAALSPGRLTVRGTGRVTLRDDDEVAAQLGKPRGRGKAPFHGTAESRQQHA